MKHCLRILITGLSLMLVLSFSLHSVASANVSNEDISDKHAEAIKELDNYNENQVDTIALEDQDDEVGTTAVPVIPIVWGGVAALVTGGTLYFSAMYFNHQEKTQLIDRCYDEGGTPVVESGDRAGLSGTTDSAAANAAGGYQFECVDD